MPETIPSPLLLERDGTSQAGRHLPGLDPESVGIDERGLADWLAFAQAYSRELTYYDLDNQPGGDWGGFLNPNGLADKDLPTLWQDIERFLADPDRFDDASSYRRPHFVLFLAFLRLLGLSGQRLNRLTRQHLDFYYRTVLSLEKQAARPDRVNILAVLSADAKQALLPAGSLLEAGKDSQGGELFYRTDADLLVGRAQVKSLYSVFVDKKITGIRQAREASSVTSGDPFDPLLAMFAIVYGEPTPGDPPPPYLAGQALDKIFLARLAELVGFVWTGLYLEFQELRNLMRLKTQRQQSASQDWTQINGTLTLIGQAVVGGGFAIDPPDSQDFKANLKKALNGKDLEFSKLPNDVRSLEDIYWQRNEESPQRFVAQWLKISLAQFAAMMETKIQIDNDWRIVNGLLEVAGKRQFKNPDYRLVPDDPASSAFDRNLASALGGAPDFSGFGDVFDPNKGLDGFYSALQQVEAYFYCSLEDFTTLLQAGDKQSQADWDRVYAILAAAYVKKVHADRRKKLYKLRLSAQPKGALESMLRLALGEPSLAANELVLRLSAFWPNDSAVSLDTVKQGMAVGDLPDTAEPYWQNLADSLELAWHKREGTEPVAQQEEWRNLYASEDATSAKAANLIGTPRWRTFGQGRPAPAKDQPPAPLLGWAIASPLLCLSQGERDVTLTLVFQAENYDSQKIADLLPKRTDPAIPVDPALYPFQVEASSEKGWMASTTLTIESGDYNIKTGWVPQAGSGAVAQENLKALRLTLGFDASAPAVAALPNGESRWPMLRLLLRPAWKDNPGGGGYVTPYPLFQALALDRALVEVTVNGLKDLRLENDDGSLSAGKPFEPFGSSPSVGSGFQFVHPELLLKRLDWLDIKLQWMKVPEPSLAEYYKNYPVGIQANGDFTAKFSQVDRQLDIPLVKKAALFEADDTGKAHTLGIEDVNTSIQDSRPGYAYQPELAAFDLGDSRTWPRYWRFELNAPDFQHNNYIKVSAAKSAELSAAIAASLRPAPPEPPAAPSAADYQVNPPYTPKLKSFSVDYGSSVEIVLSAGPDSPPDIKAKGYGKGEERIFHRLAFGVAEIQAEPSTGLYRFLPAYPYEGELCIGLEGVAEPQDVAILFQMAAGSANPDLPPQPVQWSYLSGNQWLSLNEGGVLADATGGLAGPGIITFRLPQALPNTLLPANLYWLRAAVAQHCDSLCDTIALHAQAVSATWADRGNAPDHLNQPLPAGTITKLASSVPGIQAIRQPYTSFGGKPGEQDALFNTRVSERLRHKQRAQTLWDYEHLILERFPAIYKAKCIPADSSAPADLGKVDIIVIPDIRDQLPFNPFEPKATAGQIAEIDAFLQGRVPALAEVKVRNAHYVPVRVRVAVRFMADCDPGFYTTRLNEDLNRFLSPWAYQEGCDVVIGGKIYANAIVDFLERRPYVDYVAELKLFKNEDGLGFTLEPDSADDFGYRVQTARSDGVLVADPQHVIDLITDARFEDAKFTGIGYMKIELDFIVN